MFKQQVYQYQAKKWIRQARIDKFALLNLRQMFKLSPSVSKTKPDTTVNQLYNMHEFAGTVSLTVTATEVRNSPSIIPDLLCSPTEKYWVQE
jgi:hypothetical protein